MKTCKPIYDAYCVRTQAYYLRKGGGFAELVGLVSSLKALPRHRTLPSVEQIINRAAYASDAALYCLGRGEPLSLPEGALTQVVAEAYCLLQYGENELSEALGKLTPAHKTYYPHFSSLLSRLRQPQQTRTDAEALAKAVAEAARAEIQKTIDSIIKKTDIMDPDNHPRIVNNNEMHNCNVFMGDSIGGVFPLPGAHVTINQQLSGKRPKAEEQTATESAEDRRLRKEAVIGQLCRRLNFAPDMLKLDHNHRPITNERLGVLLRRTLGMGTVPPRKEYLASIETLWTLLIDERNQCAKQPDEPFFRQTVLNIFGYYTSSGIISGMPRELAQCIFPEADTNLAKNISRGISSNVYPEELPEIMDHYINQLLNGEF